MPNYVLFRVIYTHALLGKNARPRDQENLIFFPWLGTIPTLSFSFSFLLASQDGCRGLSPCSAAFRPDDLLNELVVAAGAPLVRPAQPESAGWCCCGMLLLLEAPFATAAGPWFLNDLRAGAPLDPSLSLLLLVWPGPRRGWVKAAAASSAASFFLWFALRPNFFSQILIKTKFENVRNFD